MTYKIKKTIRVSLIVLCVTICLAGCVMGSSVSDNQAHLANNTIDSLDSRYIYKEPLYNIGEDHIFVYSGVALGNLKPSDIFKVYIDSSLEHNILTKYTYDTETKQLVISPPQFPLLSDAGDRVDFVNYNSNWGYAPKYWVVQYYDLNTGYKLLKPLVMEFSIRRKLSTPTVELSVDSNGKAIIQWNEIDNATKYEIVKLEYSDLYGLTLSAPEVIGETTDLAFTNFVDGKDNMEYAYGVIAYTDADIGGVDLGKLGGGELCGGKLGGGRSNISNIVKQSDIVSSLPRPLEIGDIGNVDYIYNSYEKLPLAVPVNMYNGDIIYHYIDYSRAEYNKGVDTVVIAAPISGTPFSTTLTLQYTEESGISLEELANTLSKRYSNMKLLGNIGKTNVSYEYTAPIDITSKPFVGLGGVKHRC